MRRVFAVAVSAVLLLSCDYTLPLTEEPTRKVNPALLGTWAPLEEQDEAMTVRMYDDHHYVIATKGDLYRAHHTDVAGLPLISVQNLNDSDRKWLYVVWKLSADGSELTMRSVNVSVVPDGTRESILEAIAANRDNPKLFNDEGRWKRTSPK